MSADFALSPTTRDLVISGGALALAAKAPEVAQRLVTRLRRQKGEWFLNQTVGVPWYGNAGILGSVNQQGQSPLSNEATATAGVPIPTATSN